MELATGIASAGTGLYHVWREPGQSFAVYLSAEVAQKILLDAVRGLALVPRRGAEVGGILLGTIEEGDEPAVVVDDLVPVACEYAFGPSYLLSQDDRGAFLAAMGEWSSPTRGIRAVGFYRTHTRPGLEMSAEDVELFSDCFPDPRQIAMVVKPHAMRSSTAAFFFREDGVLRASSECLGLTLADSRQAEQPAAEAEPPREAAVEARPASDVPLPSFIEQSLDRPRRRLPRPAWHSWWVQVPLLAVLLAVDAFLGYAAARSLPARSAATQPQRDPYALSLVVIEFAENLHLRWARDSVPVGTARRGLLEISDGEARRTLELSAEQLRGGSVMYRRQTGTVGFRLEVFVRDNTSVSQSWGPVTLQELSAAPAPQGRPAVPFGGLKPAAAR